jgi:cell wall-associated NlpC family hydrolase
MSLAAAADRIGAIQTLLQDLATPPVARAASTAATTATAPASATDFARVLQDAVQTSAADGAVTGTDIVEQAKQYLGVPYVFGGEDETGMDCSGLVQRVLADLGIDAPRVVQDQADIGVEVPSLDQAMPGDLLVTKGEGHIVIYAGDGKIIHAPRPGKDVQLVDNYLSPSEISTIRRVVPAEAPAVAAASITSPSVAAPSAVSADAAALLSVMQGMFASQATALPQSLLGPPSAGISLGMLS